MKKLAHIVNPIQVPETSDLFAAQPITFETMRRAKDQAGDEIEIKHFSAQYREDLSMVPADFHPTKDLDRSVLDVAKFRHFRKLPLLKDILDRLYSAAPDADYLIYSNVDIAVQSTFYNMIGEFIDAGFDAFVINRRTIPGYYKDIDEIPAMMKEKGVAHRGWDCFVFSRSIFPQFKLFDICVGATRVGLALLANMEAYGWDFHEFKDEHLTFHIGDERNWLNPVYSDYDNHNTKELMRILGAIEAEKGPFGRNTIPGSFLFRKRTFGPFYEFWTRHVYLPVGLSQVLNRLTGRR